MLSELRIYFTVMRFMEFSLTNSNKIEAIIFILRTKSKINQPLFGILLLIRRATFNYIKRYSRIL